MLTAITAYLCDLMLRKCSADLGVVLGVIILGTLIMAVLQDLALLMLMWKVAYVL